MGGGPNVLGSGNASCHAAGVLFRSGRCLAVNSRHSLKLCLPLRLPDRKAGVHPPGRRTIPAPVERRPCEGAATFSYESWRNHEATPMNAGARFPAGCSALFRQHWPSRSCHGRQQERRMTETQRTFLRPPVLLARLFTVPELFRFGGFADAVGSVEPAAQVDHLAAIAAKRTVGRILVSPDRDRFLTGGTLKSRHGSSPEWSVRSAEQEAPGTGPGKGPRRSQFAAAEPPASRTPFS